MTSNLSKIIRGCLPLVLWVIAANLAPAAVVNFLFDGGIGWTASDPAFVSYAGGQATIAEHTLDNEVRLSRQFVFPAGSQRLSFRLVTTQTEPDGGFLPDAFNVSLLNSATLLSVVPTVDAFTDAYYTRDLLNGVTQGMSASGVAQFPAASALPLTVSLDVAALSGQEAILQFNLIGGGVDFSSFVTLDQVQLTAVPEPSNWITIFAGMALTQVRLRRKA